MRVSTVAACSSWRRLAYITDGWLAIKEVPGSERQNFMFN